MNDVLLSVFARTDVGMQRSGNEDAFLVADLTRGNAGLGPDMSTHNVGERGSLMVVSDGMGGAAAGEIASEMAVTTIREALGEIPLDLDHSKRLGTAVEVANQKIWGYAQENPELTGMGATLTGVLVQGTTAFIAQVGDSRAYMIRGTQIKQLTKDQSLAQVLVDSGVIAPEQAASVPQNVIMQALGTQPDVKVALTSVDLCKNDVLVLCSDGLSNKVGPEEMRNHVLSTSDPSEACRQLVQMANERGGEDNITVVIARFDGDSLHSASDGSTITGSYQVLSPDLIGEMSRVTSPLGSAASDPEADQPQDSAPVLQDAETSETAETAEGAEPAEADAAPLDIESEPTVEVATEDDPGPRISESAAARTRHKGAAGFIVAWIISIALIGLGGFAFYRSYLKAQLENRDEIRETAPETPGAEQTEPPPN